MYNGDKNVTLHGQGICLPYSVETLGKKEGSGRRTVRERTKREAYELGSNYEAE